jgi:acetyl esterase/lipase
MTPATTFDGGVFSPDAIAPETAAANAQLAEQMAAAPHRTELSFEDVRRAREETGGLAGPPRALDFAEERVVNGTPVRLLRPERVDGVYISIHGGGWTVGRAWHSDEAMWALAQACNLAIVIVDYRLAPEHPYPAGPDDCEGAAGWTVEHAAEEFGTDRIVIGGGSAGAHLAAVTLLRMRDRHGYTGFAGADLVFGAYDMGGTPSMHTLGRSSQVWDERAMTQAAEAFAPGQDLRDPDISPLYASLEGMPPALFSVGTLDPLVDDSIFMHARWIEYGGDAELALYPGGVHGFTAFDIPIAHEAEQRRLAFIERCISGG